MNPRAPYRPRKRTKWRAWWRNSWPLVAAIVASALYVASMCSLVALVTGSVK